MFKLEQYTEKNNRFVRLKNERVACWLTICLTQGGMVTELGVNGEELLYLNKETLFDEKKPIRGGIPVLFPSSGKLNDNAYTWNERQYQMPLHGFARDHSWNVVSTNLEEEVGSITLSLESTEEMLQLYPFDFKLLFTYNIANDGLTITQSYQNNTNEPMPIYPGFHPYFQTENEWITINTKAPTYLDLKDNQENEFSGSIKKQDLEPSVIFTNKQAGTVSIQVKEQLVMMAYGSEFKYTVFWTEKGENYVCMEPWMALPNALNEKKGLVCVDANSRLDTFVSFKVS
ncbi:aldose epimerase [Paraliobacillus sp. JSM ZJ581]|uniref:aldose epimerase family protein n=1 Tax=Paraliobacillus sp. JSM ZJ581 TaxID=3342118 RepID=UPI0035A829F2